MNFVIDHTSSSMHQYYLNKVILGNCSLHHSTTISMEFIPTKVSPYVKLHKNLIKNLLSKALFYLDPDPLSWIRIWKLASVNTYQNRDLN